MTNRTDLQNTQTIPFLLSFTMKVSIIALAALVSGAVAVDKPHFLNSDINPEEGTPFTFKYDNCPDGCTIILQSGSDQKNLQTITCKSTSS